MSFRRFIRVLRRLLLVLVILTAVVCGGSYLYHAVFGYQLDSGFDDMTDEEALAVNTKPATGVTNVALFGVDVRSEEAARSDCMIVMTVDADRGKIKLTSLMRDSRVPIDGHGKTKLCHAYGYDGPAGAIRAINENFGLDITDYAEVDFITMANLIGEVGGVMMDVSEAERKEANKFIREYYESYGAEPVLIAEPGLQRLDGVQAMSYARIRKGGTGDDWGRVERQSKVLEAMFAEVRSKSMPELIGMMPRLLPYVRSSLKPTEMISLGLGAFAHGVPEIEHARIPLDGEWDYGGSSGEYIVYDLEKAAKRLDLYIYDDIAPKMQNKDATGPREDAEGAAPDKSGEADKPDKPAKPDKPDKPAKPDKPDKPAKPDKPDKPEKSDEDEKPKPDKPDKDDAPKQDKPAPDQSADPERGDPEGTPAEIDPLTGSGKETDPELGIL